MRKVLAIPLEEVAQHLALNTRQDVTIVAPEILAGELIAKLTAAGSSSLPERLAGGRNVEALCRHDAPNALCESHDFSTGIIPETSGPFALCFGNEKGAQDAHYHPHHLEIYFSEHPLDAEYRLDANSPIERVRLEKGGVLIFTAGVIHRARLGGLTMVIEIPAMKDDKVVVEM